jgi:type I restriction-modification system DNA methylase subunit
MSKEGNFTKSHLLREFIKNYEQNQSSKIKNIGEKGVTYTPSQIVNSMILNTFYWYIKGIFPDLKIKKCDFSIQNLFENIKQQDYNAILLKVLRNIKILDPSAGTGRFLLNLSKFLFEMFIKLKDSTDSLNLKKKIIENNLYGYEINKESCLITKIQLLNWLFQGEKDLFPGENLDFTSIKQTIEKEQIKFHIFHSDYLLEEFNDQRFDIII